MMSKRQDGGRPEHADLAFGPLPRPGAPTAAREIPRDDILNYVHEMCATLSYLSITHNCERLSGLLAAAAAEAESQITGNE